MRADPTCPVCGDQTLKTTNSRTIANYTTAYRDCETCGARVRQTITRPVVINSEVLCGTARHTTHLPTETR